MRHVTEVSALAGLVSLSSILDCRTQLLPSLGLLDLKCMPKFSRTYPDLEFAQRTVSHISWQHYITLLDKAKD
jgi:hypothetical protein